MQKIEVEIQKKFFLVQPRLTITSAIAKRLPTSSSSPAASSTTSPKEEEEEEEEEQGREEEEARSNALIPEAPCG